MVRVGDQLTVREPLVLGFGFGSWRLEPATALLKVSWRRRAPGRATLWQVGGDVRVCTFTCGPPQRVT